MLTVASGSIYLLFDALCYVLPLNKWTDKSIAEQISPFLFIDSKHCFEQQLTKCLVIRFKFNSVSLSLSLFWLLFLSPSQPLSLSLLSLSLPTSFTLSLSFTCHLFHCLWLCLSHGLVMFRIFQCNVCVCNEKSTSIPPPTIQFQRYSFIQFLGFDLETEIHTHTLCIRVHIFIYLLGCSFYFHFIFYSLFYSISFSSHRRRQ